MDKKDYLNKLNQVAIEEGYSAEEIGQLTNYATILLLKKLPVIFNVVQLSMFLGVDERYLYKVSNKPKLFYNKFIIKKKNGKKRIIHEPLPTLKHIQQWINKNILSQVKSSPFSKAYKKNVSIIDNAKFHVNQNFLICMDIEDYFGNISQYQVFNMFNELGYNKSVSSMLSRLCCLNNSIPQGAPTSPTLSNIVTTSLDTEIANYAKAKGEKDNSIRYTRYADDISLSSNVLKVNEVIIDIKQILKKHGFNLNHDKTRVLKKNNSQKVTGLVVNEKVNVHQKVKREIRQEVFYIEKFGIEDHIIKKSLINETNISYLQKLLGRINFVLNIESNNAEFNEYKIKMISLYKGQL